MALVIQLSARADSPACRQAADVVVVVPEVLRERRHVECRARRPPGEVAMPGNLVSCVSRVRLATPWRNTGISAHFIARHTATLSTGIGRFSAR